MRKSDRDGERARERRRREDGSEEEGVEE